ncbi:MAG: RidA family protein [Proteobacteria bacterium]|nr:RidA family protein [Pseudomonadota bacterium]
MGETLSTGRKVLVNPPGSERVYRAMQFSQAVRVGDTVWISGQVGVDSNGRAPEGIEAQTRLAFQNLERVLAAAGGALADIVELTTFHTSMADIRGFSKVKAEFIPEDYPAWTAVGVTGLVMPQLLVEVRATAVVSGRPAD